MASEDEMEARLDRIDRKVELAMSDASAARTLASGASKDVVDYREKLKSDARTLSALRETQMEHSQTLRKHSQILQEHSEQLATLQTEVREGFSQVREGFATQAVGQREITQLLTRIIDEGK